MRDIGNRQDILGHIIAGNAISARGGSDEPAVFVEQRNRHTVHLRLDRKMDCPFLGELADAGHKLAQFLGGIGVVEALHRHEVLGRGEFLERLAADAPGRGILGGELRVLIFEVLEFAQEGIEFLIRNLRRGVLVVELIVTLEFRTETRDLLANARFVELG